jgi:hypothetical protein
MSEAQHISHNHASQDDMLPYLLAATDVKICIRSVMMPSVPITFVEGFSYGINL